MKHTPLHNLSVGILGVSVLAIGSHAAFSQTPQPLATPTPALPQNTAPYGPTQVDTAALVIPNAQEIILDLPSALLWSRHQRGEMNGYRYILFPDGSGTVMEATGQRSILYHFNCKKSVSCQIKQKGGETHVVRAVGGSHPLPPNNPNSRTFTRFISRWILAETGKPTKNSGPRENPHPALAELIQAPQSQTQPQASTPPQTATPTLASSSQRPTVTQSHKPTAAAPIISTKKPTLKLPVTPKLSAQQDAKTANAQPKEEQTFFQRINLACSFTGSTTLRYRHHQSRSERFGKPRLSVGCRARLSPKLSLGVSVIGYLDPSQKSDSDAEFTYALTYRATDKINFTYSNYTARFGGAENPLTSGALRASYKLPTIPLPFDKSARCTASIALPDPRESSMNLSCGVAVTRKLSVGFSAFAYFPGEQSDSDPDFSYTARYKIADDWAISYSNYTNNRFPWNKSKNSGFGVLGGSISVTHSIKF